MRSILHQAADKVSVQKLVHQVAQKSCSVDAKMSLKRVQTSFFEAQFGCFDEAQFRGGVCHQSEI